MPKKPDQALAAELEKLLTKADTAISDRIALRDAICAYFNAERAIGTSLATILNSVTEILESAEKRVFGGQDGQDELAQQMIAWCVELDRAGNIRS